MSMADFQARGRSISLPTRLQDPGLPVVDEWLGKLRASEEESASSLSSITNRIVGLSELYTAFTELILQSTLSTKQALVRYDQGRLVEDALESSLPFLAACTSSRDVASSLKDHARGLESALRRTSRLDEPQKAAYTAFRKNSKKELSKCIRELNRTELKPKFSPLLDTEPRMALIIRALQEVVSISKAVFQSLLAFLSTPIRSTKWSLILRLGPRKGAEKDTWRVLNEVSSVDAELFCSDADDSVGLQSRLRELDFGCHNLENALETLFRRLVQNRVAFLNILTS